MSPEKGHLVLLDAVAQLAAEGRRRELVLAGDGPLRPEIERAIDRRQLRDAVRMAGWLSAKEVREEILRSRALVLPSFAEGLPVVIMEALALGRPVIATAIAAVPELVEPGIGGWVVPAGSGEALAAALREALEAPVEALADMGKAGAAAVARRHDAAAEARKLAALFARAGSR
jgi:glycosyltransferase involved in cell wall biosynthesis